MTEYEPSPILPIGSKKFLCIEYPGVVKRPKRAIKTLGGEKSLAQSLVQKQEVNLWHRPEDPFSHPIQGELNETSKLLAKITRKIKRNKLTGEVVETSSDWSVEIIGSVNHVVRFRALADLQYIVPKENRINKLTEALNVGNVEALMKFDIRPEEKETDLLIDAIPPPIFSTRLVPVNYGYRQNLPVMRVKMKQPDGSYKIGLINRDRRSGLEITQVKFDAEKIPSESWQLLQVITDTIILQTIELVKKLFEERPIWTRLALKGQMDPKYHKYMKTALVHCAYTFVNGAWRDTWVKYGVDPRKSPEFYKYQIINVRRNTQPDSKNRRVRSQKSFVHRRKDVTDKESTEFQENYIFDGKNVCGPYFSKFQICDITDPQLVPIIECKDYLKTECSYSSGFYYQCVHDYIRECLKQKYLLLLEQKSSTISIVPEKTLLEKVEAEKEKNKQEKEENTLLSAEKAVLEAQTEMATPETSKRLKDVVDEYIEEFERSANDHSRYLDAGDDSDFDIDDVFDEYDEDFDVFHENERNGTDNEDENQLEDMDIDDETINMDVDMNK